MLLPLAASAQGGPESGSKHFRAFVTHHTKNLIDAAEAMPADKYSYKPTAAQWTFGKIIAHMAGDNRITCSAIAGVAPEKSPEPSATASKEELVTALLRSLPKAIRVNVIPAPDHARAGLSGRGGAASRPKARSRALRGWRNAHRLLTRDEAAGCRSMAVLKRLI